MVRLDRLISTACGVKVSEAQQIIRNGDVVWEDTVITSPGWQVVQGLERISVNGGPELALREPVLLLMHKARGLSCERERGSDSWLKARGRKSEISSPELDGQEAIASCVYDVVPTEFQHPTLGVFGRLDKQTTGLLLLGQDGGLQSMLMHPLSNCVKVYRASLKTDDDAWVLDVASATDTLAQGCRLADGTECAPAELEVLEYDALNGRPSLVRVRVHEGKYHVVKRLLAAVRGWVTSLHREAIGTLRDDALPVGQVRLVTKEELASLVASCISIEVRDGTEGPRRGVPGTGRERPGS